MKKFHVYFKQPSRYSLTITELTSQASPKHKDAKIVSAYSFEYRTDGTALFYSSPSMLSAAFSDVDYVQEVEPQEIKKKKGK